MANKPEFSVDQIETLYKNGKISPSTKELLVSRVPAEKEKPSLLEGGFFNPMDKDAEEKRGMAGKLLEGGFLNQDPVPPKGFEPKVPEVVVAEKKIATPEVEKIDPSMFANTYEPESVPEGEYNLRVTNIEEKDSQKTGGKFLQVTMEILDKPKAKNIYHIMMFPTAQDDEKKKNGRLNAIQKFVTAFGADITAGVDLKSLIGNSGWAILREENDPEYGTKNSVKKFVLPQA